MNRPVVWTIAGTDPSSGAGIQADLKTLHSLGAYACTVITAVIAQNTRGVTCVESVHERMLRAQIRALAEDVPPVAVKIGMLGARHTAQATADFLKQSDAFAVYDPVMISSSGHGLMEDDALAVITGELLPQVDLLTPNASEAETLCGVSVRSQADMEKAAERLLARGVGSVLMKGGHVEGAECCDLWTDGKSRWWLCSPRMEVRHTHGTGCTLSSAIAAALASGLTALDAVVVAKAYVNQGLRLGGGIGSGRGPLAHEGWPEDPADLPRLRKDPDAREAAGAFPSCGKEPLGFYPIVPRASWLERLLPLGVRTIQLRCKDLSGEAFDREVAAAVRISERFSGTRLIINDNWRAAMRHRAYGVHLGQSDVGGADLAEIRAAGIRLGVSAYTYADLAVACGLRPSYIAFGALYSTQTKDVQTPPLGPDGFRRMKRLAAEPSVAIGGITLDRAPEVLRAGADGIAVISDLLGSPDPEARAREWLGLTQKFHAARAVLGSGF